MTVWTPPVKARFFELVSCRDNPSYDNIAKILNNEFGLAISRNAAVSFGKRNQVVRRLISVGHLLKPRIALRPQRLPGSKSTKPRAVKSPPAGKVTFAQLESCDCRWPFGDYAHTYWMMIGCNVLIPQFLWIPWFRTNVIALWVLSIFVNIGMWLERYVIIVTSLHRDFLPSSWGMFQPTFWDYSTFVGTIGLFLALLFLFLRFLPMISIFEMRTMLPEARVDDDARSS